MKQIIKFFIILIATYSYSQNQNWSGTKNIINGGLNPFKLSNVLQNNANTKILSLDSLGKLEWVEKSTLSGSLNLQQVTSAGNTTNNGLIVGSNSQLNTINIYSYDEVDGTDISTIGSIEINNRFNGVPNAAAVLNGIGNLIMSNNDSPATEPNFMKLELKQLYFQNQNTSGGNSSYILKFPVMPTSAANIVQTIPYANGNTGVVSTTAPTSATDTGVVGEIRVTSSFLYVCIATNTWVRSSLATW